MNTGAIILIILLFVLMISGMGFGAYMYSRPETDEESEESEEPKNSELEIIKYITDKFSSPGYYGFEGECRKYFPNGLITIVGDNFTVFRNRGDDNNNNIPTTYKIKSKSNTKLSASLTENGETESLDIILINGKLHISENKRNAQIFEVYKCK